MHLGIRPVRTAFALCALTAAATGAAQAQSSVTLYGYVDMGISKSNSGTTPGTSLNGRDVANTWTVKQGGGSRVGFRGQEDLGGGLYTRFNIEHRLNPDTGASTSGTTFWQGRSVVALGSKDYGEVYVGRDLTPAYWVAAAVDPTGWLYVSQTGTAYTYGNWTGSSTEASNIRWNNSIGYNSPKLGGLSTQVVSGLGEGARKRSTSANLQYDANNIYLGAAYEGLDSKNHMTLLAGGYNFGLLTARVSVTQVKGGVNGDANAASFGVVVPVSTGRFFVQGGRLDPLGPTNTSKMLGAGYEHNLSKRTMLYVNVGTAKRETFTRTTAFDTGLKVFF